MRRSQREQTTQKCQNEEKKKVIDSGVGGRGEMRGGEGVSAAKNRRRRDLQNSSAKTQVNCDENGCSHDHNSCVSDSTKAAWTGLS